MPHKDVLGKKKRKKTLNEICLRMCLETRSGEWTFSRKMTKQKEQETKVGAKAAIAMIMLTTVHGLYP